MRTERRTPGQRRAAPPRRCCAQAALLLTTVFCIVRAALFGPALRADTPLTERLDLQPSFPRTVFFRHEKPLASLSTEDAVETIAPFDAISVKLFVEAARQDYRALIPKMIALKQRKPRMPILLHLDHFSAVRPLEGTRLSPGRTFAAYEPRDVFPGHWLYYPHSTLTQAVSAQASVLRVADIARFQRGDDVRLCPAAAMQQAQLWRESEVVFVESIDERQHTLTVRRGMYATKACPFAAHTLALPHCKLKYGNPAWYWCYNLAPECPRDDRDRTFAQWFPEWLAREVRAVNTEAGMPVIDGVEFDVTKFVLTFGAQPLEGMEAKTAKGRALDCDLDGAGDAGYFHGQPTHGFGTIQAVKRLRELMGPNFLIVGDSIWTLWRPWPYANGMDNESFPDIRRDWRWSAAFERIVAWQQYSSLPRFSLIFTRATHDLLPGQKDAYQTVRHALAVAVLTDCWHCVSGLPGGNPRLPDEYVGGTLAKPHWLGQPLGPFVRTPQCRGANLAAYGTFDTVDDVSATGVQARDGYRVVGPVLDVAEPYAGNGCLRIEMAELPPAPRVPKSFEAGLILPFAVEPGREYTIDFRARAEHGYAEPSPACAGVPWGLTVSLWSGKGGRENTAQHALLIPSTWRQVHISAVARPGKSPAHFMFELGSEPGVLWLDEVHVREGGADVFYRRFEGGLVLVNGSRSIANFDLAGIEPSRELNRLKATQVDGRWQSDPAVNSGAAVDKSQPLPLAPFDAFFLAASGLR